jgi:glycosyltransferase involved in cell wall biosynthesis
MAPVRIAFSIDSLKLGGAERVLLRWAGWCRDAGWDVVVITRQSSDRDVYPLPPGVRRCFEPSLPAAFERLGWLAFPLRVHRLRSLLRRERCQLAVGVTTLPAVKLLLACYGLPIRCVVSERNYPPAKPPLLPWRWLRRLTYPWADLNLVQTQITGFWLREHCGVRRQLLLPNPVAWPLPDREPAVDPDHWLAPGVPLLLGVGTKAKQKGFDRFIPVFSALAQETPSLHLAFVGLPQGSYQGVDQQAWLRDKLGQDPDLQQRLLLPGMVGTMAAWYSRATVFVLPSRFEGFPNVLLEAMAAGCACVASDCLTGPAELIEHNVNGVLLPGEASVEDWVMVIRGLLQDRLRCKALGQEATKVRERFSPERLRHDFLEALGPLSHG